MQQVIGVLFTGLINALLIIMVLLFFVIVGWMIVNLLANIIGWHRIFPGKYKHAATAYNERLLNPTPEAVEVFLGGKLPTSILNLYANQDLIKQSNLCFQSPHDPSDTGKWDLAFFTPCQVEDQEHNWLPKRDDEIPGYSTGRSGFRFFEFGNDGSGNCFYVQLSDDRQDDAPVYFFMHDGGELFEKVADSLREWNHRFIVL